MRRLLLIAVVAAAVVRVSAPARASALNSASPAPESCCLGLLPDPARPGDPRIALYRARSDGACDEMVLDTGYPLSAVEKPADRKALNGKPGPFSCGTAREGKTPRDWERALVEMLSPGFRGEALLHQGDVQRAVEAFFRGLPDPRCAAWLGQAARNLPEPVAALLPRSLKSRHLRRAESALDLLGTLVSAHPVSARDAVREALGTRHRELRPQAILLAGEEAAGLRATHPASSEADLLSQKVREALGNRAASVRAAAAGALLLAEPDGGRRIALLAAAARDERDPGTLAALLSALREAGGIEEVFSLSRAESPDLRREALRAVAGLAEWPPGEADPLERLLREDRADPGEVVRILGSRPGELPGRWAATLAEILPVLGDEDRARIPGLICRLDDSVAVLEGLSVILGMARDGTHPEAASAALAALGSCGGSRRDESLEVLLEAARGPALGEKVLAAAEAAARLAASPEEYARVLDSFRSSLDSGEEASRCAAVAGLVGLGLRDAPRPVALLAGAALRTPSDATGRAAEEGLRRMYDIEPGPVTAALREAGQTLPEADQERIFDLFLRLQPEDRERILKRWRAALASPGSRPGPALQSEMRALADYWPGEILNLIQPGFEGSRGEERIRLLDLMVALGRHLPDRILALITPLPEDSSPRLWKATREAVAATLARKVLAEKTRGPADLFGLALDPVDSERRATGRRALWLLAWEGPSFRPSLVEWARTARGRSSLPLRVELGRWLGQVSEMGPTRFPATPEARQEPRRARFPPGTSGDSGRAPAGPPGRGGGTVSHPPGAGG